MTDKPFPFDKCTDAAACNAGMLAVIKPGMDWSEVHCRGCGGQGIVRHGELLPPSQFPTAFEPVEVDPVSEPAPDVEPAPAGAPGPSGKGKGSAS
ncbi:hypothetical protein [Methylobacterium platani]|uniref:Uncharacterized protein n=2 Tax=Methylobacterium platani TaxID=427683 RepID=A0A179SAM2_9HYPH|nr:hypothetical protein [Methylobacterium platani]KMO15989.1 hypothetical protein SQ03_15545 [Methylobacterium platani JCM 14648]OAS24880.1 hypothetical protein A5481_12370 [Methylobacterium platani]